MNSEMDLSEEFELNGILSGARDNWNEFTDHLEDARDDFRIVLRDLNEARKSLGQIVGQVREVPGEIRNGIRSRIRDVTDQLAHDSEN